MGRHDERKIKRRVENSPVGAVMMIDPADITLVRYHARGCRKIKTRHDLKTGKRAVLLGEFFSQEQPRRD